MIEFLARKLLRRSFFKGQDRIFYYLFKKNILSNGLKVVRPLIGNFIIECNTSTWIGAKIVYTGDYEANLKKVFKSFIGNGDFVLDVGANIGFHTLFFAELVGNNGIVEAYEPVIYNFLNLQKNIELNNYGNIRIRNIALSNKNEQILINADKNSSNPGAFNLFDKGGEIMIDCYTGKDIVGKEKLNFIKIDVEGYECFVIEGLLYRFSTDEPILVFEYDEIYHKKTNMHYNYILDMLSPLGYHFYLIQKDGFIGINSLDKLKSSNILALPKNQNII